MDEAGDGQERQQRGDDVGHGCDLLALHAEDAEAERGEQQAAERLALEEGLTLGRDVGQLLLQPGSAGSLAVWAAATLARRSL